MSRNLSDGAEVAACCDALARAAVALAETVRAALGAAGSVPVAQPAFLISPSAPLASASPPGPASGIFLHEAVNDFLRSKARAGRSDRYLRQIRVSLRSFCQGRSRQDVAAVSPADVEGWLERSGWAPRTRRGYLGDVRTFFTWCVRRGLLARSPALGVEAPALGPQAPPGCHKPAQVEKVLRGALADGPDLARLVAVMFFAGLRSSEALRLIEIDLLRDRGFIEVRAENAKTRRRRLVKIAANLEAWLALPGTFPVRDAIRRLRALRQRMERAGVSWPHNVARHSFCTYHLASGGSAAATALAAGHSEIMLFAHYRELATPEVAAEFWAIRPD